MASCLFQKIFMAESDKSVQKHTIRGKLKYYYVQFCETTSLNGFNWLESARSNIERLLFCLLIIIGICLTIKDVVLLTQQYLSQEKKTTATIIDTDRFDFPMTLCIDIDTANLRTPGVNSSKSIKKLLQHFDKQNMIEYVGNLTLTNTSQWSDEDKSLVSLTAQMLVNIMRVENIAELDGLQVTTENLGSWGILDLIPGEFMTTKIIKLPEMVLRPGTQHSMFEINQFYAKRKVPFDQLLKLIGACLCKWLEVSAKPLSQNAILKEDKLKDICQPNSITWLGAGPKSGDWESLCIKPEAGVIQFTPDIGFVDLTVKHKMIHTLSAITDDGNYINNPNVPSLQLDFSGNRVYSALTGSSTEVFERQSKNVLTIRVTGFNKAISTDPDPCSTDLARSDCWLGCRATYIAKNCYCWPLSAFGLPQRPEGMPLCASTVLTEKNSTFIPIPIVTEPSTCGSIANQSAPDLACKTACLQNCEYMLVSFTKTDVTKLAPSDQENDTLVRMTAATVPYPLFQQSLSMVATDFLNQLGGALGLYLGKLDN